MMITIIILTHNYDNDIYNDNHDNNNNDNNNNNKLITKSQG